MCRKVDYFLPRPAGHIYCNQLLLLFTITQLPRIHVVAPHIELSLAAHIALIMDSIKPILVDSKLKALMFLLECKKENNEMHLL